MSRASILANLFVIFALLAPSAASAQAASTPEQAEATSNASIVTTAPNQPASSQHVWFQHDLEDAKARSRRARNALIGTSVAFAVGAILAGAGASQCESVYNLNNYDDLVCNTAGNVLLPLGGTIAGLGAIGMITSGIILGVSNKRKREIERDIRRSHYGRRLQWDIPSGGLVF